MSWNGVNLSDIGCQSSGSIRDIITSTRASLLPAILSHFTPALDGLVW